MILSQSKTHASADNTNATEAHGDCKSCTMPWPGTKGNMLPLLPQQSGGRARRDRGTLQETELGLGHEGTRAMTRPSLRHSYLTRQDAAWTVRAASCGCSADAGNRTGDAERSRVSVKHKHKSQGRCTSFVFHTRRRRRPRPGVAFRAIRGRVCDRNPPPGLGCGQTALLHPPEQEGDGAARRRPGSTGSTPLQVLRAR